MADSTSHGTVLGYRVEARVKPSPIAEPVKAGSQLFDREWRLVMFGRSVVGVPPMRGHQDLTTQHGLYSFESAMALAWWFLAEADSFVLECRVVKYTATIDVVIHRDAESTEPIGWELSRKLAAETQMDSPSGARTT